MCTSGPRRARRLLTDLYRVFEKYDRVVGWQPCLSYAAVYEFCKKAKSKVDISESLCYTGKRMGMNQSFPWRDEGALLLTLALVLGKTAGGFAMDILGPRRSSLWSLGAAGVLYLLSAQIGRASCRERV